MDSRIKKYKITQCSFFERGEESQNISLIGHNLINLI